MIIHPNPNKRRYLGNETYTKTTCFLLPCCEVSFTYLESYGFVNAYLGDSEFDTEGYPKELIFLLFDSTKVEEDKEIEFILGVLRQKETYITEYDPSLSTVMVVLRVPDKWIKTVYYPFIEGKYSKIEQNYRNRFFSEKVITGRDGYGYPIKDYSFNWMVLTKSSILKEEIENDLGISLPQDAEVFSKPDSKEFYRT